MLIGLPAEVIQLAIGNVSLDLLVPRLSHELLEPSVKGSQVRLRQLRHFRLQFLNAHGLNLIQKTPQSKPAKHPPAEHNFVELSALAITIHV
jgi:hypothetical protein